MDIAGLWDPEPGYFNTASYGLPPRPAFETLQAVLADWRAGHEAYWHSAEMRAYVGDPAFTVDDDTPAVALEFRTVTCEDLDLAALLREAQTQTQPQADAR